MVIMEVKSETTTKLKKVKIKEFSATLEFQRSGEAEKQRSRVQSSDIQRSRVWNSGKVEKQKEKRMKERKKEVKELQRKWSSRVTACYDFLSLFLFSHHCSITPFHFPFELSFISHA